MVEVKDWSKSRSTNEFLGTSMRASWLECLRFFVVQKFLDEEDVTGLMVKHGCVPMLQRVEVYLENPHVVCLYYSGDYCQFV